MDRQITMHTADRYRYKKMDNKLKDRQMQDWIIGIAFFAPILGLKYLFSYIWNVGNTWNQNILENTLLYASISALQSGYFFVLEENRAITKCFISTKQ